MIFKRYGTTFQSVRPDFDARALTEVSFRRDRDTSMPVADFEDLYGRVRGEELVSETSGPVQDAAEQELLELLEASLTELEASLGPDEVLVLESDSQNHPKTHDRKEPVIVDGENRLHFHWWVDPPLRIGVYRKV